MATKLLMPSLSPTMEEGTIAKWLVKEGDMIKQGTPLCSIETDKTTVDYESLDEGFLRKIIVVNGQGAKVNQLIGVLTDSKDEDFSAELAETAPAATPNTATPGLASSAAPAANAAQSQTSTPTTGHSPDGRVKASPLAKKIAQEKGITLNQVQGSGPGGRIVKQDVENYTPATTSTQVISSAVSSDAAHSKAAKIETPRFGGLAPILPTQDIPVSQMMKIIGKRLTESYQGAPAFFVTMKMDATRLLKLRLELNEVPGYKITVNDLVIKAVALNLRQFPGVNSSFHGDYIRQHSNIDISVAVSLPQGLITPIVKNADQKTIGQISADVKSLGAKAKAGTLLPEEYQGGTFSVSNMGMYGVESFTSIINPPQAAILAVAGTQEELYRENGEIKERTTLNMTLTSDHRVINGALAAEFMKGLKEIISKPASLML